MGVSRTHVVTHLPGDGVGPEVTAVARACVDEVAGRRGFAVAARASSPTCVSNSRASALRSRRSTPRLASCSASIAPIVNQGVSELPASWKTS